MHKESLRTNQDIPTRNHGHLPPSYYHSISEAHEVTITACKRESFAGKLKNVKISPNVYFCCHSAIFCQVTGVSVGSIKSDCWYGQLATREVLDLSIVILAKDYAPPTLIE
jgi:hypothetical protein